MPLLTLLNNLSNEFGVHGFVQDIFKLKISHDVVLARNQYFFNIGSVFFASSTPFIPGMR